MRLIGTFFFLSSLSSIVLSDVQNRTAIVTATPIITDGAEVNQVVSEQRKHEMLRCVCRNLYIPLGTTQSVSEVCDYQILTFESTANLRIIHREQPLGAVYVDTQDSSDLGDLMLWEGDLGGLTRLDERFEILVDVSKVSDKPSGKYNFGFAIHDDDSDTEIGRCWGLISIEGDDVEYLPSYLRFVSDFMGALRGPDGRGDAYQSGYEYIKDVVWHAEVGKEPFTPHVSAGNLIGQGVWEARHTEDYLIGALWSTLDIQAANVGDLELPYGPEKLKQIQLESMGRNGWISSNILRKDTGTLAFDDKVQFALETSALSNKAFDRIFVTAWGIMTQETSRWVPGDVLQNYIIDPDYLPRIKQQCDEYRSTSYANKCILLVAGGFNPSLDPMDEIKANETEFSRIINSLTNFEGIVGSRSFVNFSTLLPDSRWVVQTPPKGESIGVVSFNRTAKGVYKPRVEVLEPIRFAEPNEYDVSSMYLADWKFEWDWQWRNFGSFEPEELGIYTSEMLAPKDSNGHYTYHSDSPLSNVVADVILHTARAHLTPVEQPIHLALVEAGIVANDLVHLHLAESPAVANADGDAGEYSEDFPETSYAEEAKVGSPEMGTGSSYNLKNISSIESLDESIKQFNGNAIFTEAHLLEILARPDDQIVIVKLTGRELWDTIRKQWTPEGDFIALSYSNLQVLVDDRRGDGMDGITGLYHLDGETAKEIADDSSTVYFIAITSYLRSGALGHSILQNAEEVKLESRNADGPKVADLFRQYVKEVPLSASEEETRVMNGTVVIPRDCDLYVQFPNTTPYTEDEPFTLTVSVRSKDRRLTGPFNFYNREDGTQVGQLSTIYPDRTSDIVFDVHLAQTSRQLVVWATDGQWEDQAYNTELAFAIGLPSIAQHVPSCAHSKIIGSAGLIACFFYLLLPYVQW